ncbi:hypothetical protein F5Y12DRAFT_719095 [Xylaria sp. FL1777]|nr:hypothetical protein F5Y12DRAFT_719095 [Xylaria sp. FL1777]
MLSVIGIGMRAFLLLIAAVVLGLSVTLAKHQVVDQVPAETGFSTFVGASGFLVSAVGMAALWFDRIEGKLLTGLDAIVSVFYLAAAIFLTVALKNVSSCTATDDVSEYNRITNIILSGGCVTVAKGQACLYATGLDGKDLTIGRCQMARADYVFEYVGFIFGFAMIGIGYLLSRRGRGGTPTASRSYN